MNEDSPVALHFAQTKHPSMSYWCTGIKKVEISRRRGNLREDLLKYEACWITELDTLALLGINEDWTLECSCEM